MALESGHLCRDRRHRLGSFQRPKPLFVQAYERLREAILSGLLPPGMAVTEERVARSLGISRTPARQALLRLVGEGLIELRRGTGFTVADLSYQDYVEMMECRIPLELIIVRRVCDQASPDELQRLGRIIADTLSCVERGEFEAVYALNTAFHDGLVAASHNRHLARLYDSLRPAMLVSRRYLLESPVQKVAITQEHAAVYRAVQARDVQAAQRAMRKHMYGDLDRARNRLKLLTPTPSSDAPKPSAVRRVRDRAPEVLPLEMSARERGCH